MTAPIHTEQVRQGRKMANDFVSPNPTGVKPRDKSLDYQTIQHPTGVKPSINIPRYPNQNDRIAAY